MEESTMLALAFCAALITLDYLTGLAKGVVNKSISSAVMRKGLWHKVAEVAAILLAYLVAEQGKYIGLPYEIDYLVTGVVVWISVMEVTSILENLGEINPELKNITKFFKNTQTTAEKKETNNE